MHDQFNFDPAYDRNIAGTYNPFFGDANHYTEPFDRVPDRQRLFHNLNTVLVLPYLLFNVCASCPPVA